VITSGLCASTRTCSTASWSSSAHRDRRRRAQPRVLQDQVPPGQCRRRPGLRIDLAGTLRHAKVVERRP
jgi:hypothetical protein